MRVFKRYIAKALLRLSKKIDPGYPCCVCGARADTWYQNMNKRFCAEHDPCVFD